MASTLIEEWNYLFDCNHTLQNKVANTKQLKFPLNSICGTVRTIHSPFIYS